MKHWKHCSCHVGPLVGSVFFETHMVGLGWNTADSKRKSSCLTIEGSETSGSAKDAVLVCSCETMVDLASSASVRARGQAGGQTINTSSTC